MLGLEHSAHLGDAIERILSSNCTQLPSADRPTQKTPGNGGPTTQCRLLRISKLTGNATAETLPTPALAGKHNFI
ncbi:hypothetical protein SBA5_550029 [Candidatus Sulfotelmatomonas gaucii]|uniref:Uncharacterized protein n=1 Tax=Candidatus Sulfuritelmatomonas gaucii TaxID=2043161 RepID=A0A2N9LTP9_9BACT|nr:hypothetical protein SBA5_550029 [Candidatus Sulfotelmatomonas gaucii]